MKKVIQHIALALTLLITGTTLNAQSGLYVPKDGKIFFTGDSATVFSNVLNEGNFGVGRGAVINFNAKQWENAPGSLITDESEAGEGATGIGGTVRFVSSDSVPQQLNGGYNAATRQGAAFSRLEVKSKSGLELTGSNAKVRNDLKLSEGLVYIKDNILIVGDGTPGKITGYDSLHYIVTDNKSNEGFLLREGIAAQDGVVVFPVGSKENAYTPVGIRSRTQQPDNFYVNVADSVRTDAFRGDLTNNGVAKTWQVGKQLRPNKDQVDVLLEHLNKDEGSVFSANRSNAYVSQYSLYKVWDEGYPQSSPVAGNLTSGPSSPNSGVNGRTFNGSISTASYFTKLTGKGDTTKNKTVLWFNGYRIDADFARVYWRTNPEINNQYFVLQRRFSNETDFKNIDTVNTKSVNGASYNDLSYEVVDPNNYLGVTFYRLVLVDRDNKASYSNIIAIAGQPGKYKLLLWPNPTPDHFFIGLNGEVNVKTIVIWNAVGQKLTQQEVNGRRIMEFYGFRPGTYMISFISDKGVIIETKKLVVVGY